MSKMLSIGTIIAAEILWIEAGIDDNPKCRDEQTLIGGMIWSQLIIPVGLLISLIAKEQINVFVHAYFLIASIVLCFISSAVLVSLDSLYKTTITILKALWPVISTNADDPRTQKLIGELRSLLIRRRHARLGSQEFNFILLQNRNTKMYASIGFASLVACTFILTDLLILLLD